MKKFFIAIAVTLIFSPFASSAVYKGQRVFIKKCVECHDNRQKFVSSKTIFEWEDYMSNKGRELADIHLQNREAKESWNYFNSSSFTKKTKHLEDFLLEYAKDSGNVPACN